MLLDSVSIGQFMLSRPVFLMAVAAITTYDYENAAKIALLTELMWLRVIPFGKNIPYNSSIIAIIAFNISHSFGVPCAIAVMFSILPGVIYKKIEILIRKFSDITNNFKNLNLKAFIIVAGTVAVNYIFIKTMTIPGRFLNFQLETQGIENVIIYMLAISVAISSLRRILEDIK